MFYLSVIIPTYNRYDVLKRAIKSVLAQSYQNFELIVIDDGSSDNTPKIQKEFPNIRYFHQINKGVSSARNLGIEKASYDWVVFLDSDDEWMEEKLQLQVDFHRQHQDILMSYTDELWIRDGVEVKVPKKFKKYGGFIFDRCLSHCIIAPSATMIHRKLLDKVGVFDENLEVCEDYDLWLRVSKEYEIGLVDKKLITKYGGDEDQLSTKFWGMDRFRVVSLEKLLPIESTQEKLVISMLLKKYKVLLKGAIKYDRILQIKEYEERIKYYE